MIWQTAKSFPRDPVSSDCTASLWGSRRLSGNSWPGLLQTSDGCWAQSAPCVSAHFASGLSSLAGSWVLYENRNEFTEKSGVPPSPFSPTPQPNPAVTLTVSELCSLFAYSSKSNPNPLQFSKSIWHLSLCSCLTSLFPLSSSYILVSVLFKVVSPVKLSQGNFWRVHFDT